VAVPTLRVLAENAPPDARQVIIVLDAKREQIFTARFQRTAQHWSPQEPAHLDSLSSMLDRSPRPVHLLGEGIPFHNKFIPKDDPSIVVTSPQAWRARALVVARIGHELAQAKDFVEPDRLLPIYIRPPEAEEKFEAQNR